MLTLSRSLGDQVAKTDELSTIEEKKLNQIHGFSILMHNPKQNAIFPSKISDYCHTSLNFYYRFDGD